MIRIRAEKGHRPYKHVPNLDLQADYGFWLSERRNATEPERQAFTEFRIFEHRQELRLRGQLYRDTGWQAR